MIIIYDLAWNVVVYSDGGISLLHLGMPNKLKIIHSLVGEKLLCIDI